MNDTTCPYCGAEKKLGFLCPECGRTGKRVFVIAYRSSYGFQEVEVEGFDNAQDQVASITNAGCFLVGITEKEVVK
ncbi:hypothetical protein NE584_00515 [Clostridium sp. DFI.5.61]|uniref:hypothetical protein n=1 Tax=Clostridium sp. DFI.5.61 TaxID=2965279 RepID=UPI00210B3149|nr:hypothetical protein [Clostridium sp. DFI.5.61]MCB5924198.1 hypothetical protein [bacterium 210820-DFI.5.26]MCQ5157522.1 hypothetical protein [Clostridium sp. DFI.5.61]